MSFYLLIAAISFLLLYFAVKKFTLNIDENTLLEKPKASIYPEFCDLINEKIVAFKKQAQSFENALLDSDKKGECLEKLGDLTRRLTFLQTMNLSKKNDSIWQSELFGFLKELESVVISHFKDGEKKADELRDELANEFKKLQKRA